MALVTFLRARKSGLAWKFCEGVTESARKDSVRPVSVFTNSIFVSALLSEVKEEFS